MPHRRSPEALERRRQRYILYKQQKAPKILRFDVSPNFSAKQISQVKITDNYGKVMLHIRKSVGLCQWCGSTKNLNVHHINKNRLDNRVENLIVLCRSCHVKEHLRIKNAIQS